jgi:hypothetical protein
MIAKTAVVRIVNPYFSYSALTSGVIPLSYCVKAVTYALKAACTVALGIHANAMKALSFFENLPVNPNAK